MRRYDLMHNVNARGTFLCTKLCLPHLSRAQNPHVLMLSPPLNMNPEWFAKHLAYTISKYSCDRCGWHLDVCGLTSSPAHGWRPTSVCPYGRVRKEVAAMGDQEVIHSDPEILGGTPVFVGTRVPAQTLLDYLEGGHPLADFLDDFPTVTKAQAIAALEQAKHLLVSRATAA